MLRFFKKSTFEINEWIIEMTCKTLNGVKIIAKQDKLIKKKFNKKINK